MKAILLFIKKLHQLWKSAAPKRIKLQTSTWAHFKELCLFFKMSLSWAQLLNFLGDTSSQSGKGICHFCENNIDFGRLSLLNELSYRPQLGVILKRCVCSLKWAQDELDCSIRLRDISFRSYLVYVPTCMRVKADWCGLKMLQTRPNEGSHRRRELKFYLRRFFNKPPRRLNGWSRGLTLGALWGT